MRPAFVKLLSASFLAIAAFNLSAQDWAKAALEKSPRHREYVPLKHGDRTVQAFVVYPEVSNKAPVIVLIHEIFGLSDWAKLMADELAAKGYIVIAPDLLTGAGPNGGGTDSLGGQDAVTKAVSGLNPDQVTADLDAAADYGKKLPAGNGKLYVTGFCWGGGKSFEFATHRHDLSAAFVFYGPPPQPDQMKSITAPVYGFYAGNDARISSTVPATTDAMKAAGKSYDPVVYDGAGHGFMRAGQAPDANDANKKAWNDGFAKMTSVINKGGSAAVTPGLEKPAPASRTAGLAAAVAAMDCHDEAHSTAGEMAALMKK
ncbi:MAG TPA: dienelactone hydrolase family protein [Acidobacteriaceae bacterium]|jgi:carboxymethylenebutenolidase|nr:dienelactone hydrolase family protein [Acidobacteriaceae bacterium]